MPNCDGLLLASLTAGHRACSEHLKRSRRILGAIYRDNLSRLEALPLFFAVCRRTIPMGCRSLNPPHWYAFPRQGNRGTLHWTRSLNCRRSPAETLSATWDYTNVIIYLYRDGRDFHWRGGRYSNEPLSHAPVTASLELHGHISTVLTRLRHCANRRFGPGVGCDCPRTAGAGFRWVRSTTGNWRLRLTYAASHKWGTAALGHWLLLPAGSGPAPKGTDNFRSGIGTNGDHQTAH